MTVFTHKHGPMLRWVRVLVDFFCDHFANHSLLGEPFPGRACHWMPANLNGAVLAIDIGLAWRYDIGFTAESNGMLQFELSLQKLFSSSRKSLVANLA
jgi:hypothetical protein